jgi:hypothetical protein
VNSARSREAGFAVAQGCETIPSAMIALTDGDPDADTDAKVLEV